MHQFQRKLVEFLTAALEQKPIKIIYVSDGCAAQYKNRKKILINLCHHIEDFGVQAEWTSSQLHTCEDGIAGSLKRLATKD